MFLSLNSLHVQLVRTSVRRIDQSYERALTIRSQPSDQGHTLRHSHTRPRSRLIRASQTGHSRLHLLLFAFFQNADSRLRGLVRPSIAESRGSRAGIARALEAMSKLSLVRDLAKTCSLGGRQVELQERRVSFSTHSIHIRLVAEQANYVHRLQPQWHGSRAPTIRLFRKRSPTLPQSQADSRSRSLG